MNYKYFLHGKLTAKPGQREALADILLQASQLVSAAPGCRLYTISTDKNDQDSVYVTEIWDNKDDHDQSLKAEDIRALIMKAMPLLDSTPEKGQELDIIGGAGI